MTDERILLSLPHMGGNEQKWIDRAFTDNWVVPLGPNVDEFEHLLSDYLGGRPVVALSAGTAAIHLALVMLGVGPGDEVLCQSMTFSASANPIAYLGATPVFVGSEAGTWNMDPMLLEQAIINRYETTGRYPKAIIPVWLYGMPPMIDRIMQIANKYGIPVVEDSAEALGSTFNNRHAGTFGTYGIISFNGNKVITTSGGGALVCPDEESANRVRFLATQARENKPYYYHKVIGYNYRMSNISAGIGCGQMQVLQEHVNRRREIHRLYVDGLSRVDGIKVKSAPMSIMEPNYWLTTILLDPDIITTTPDEMRQALAGHNIETRLLWRPMSMQPVFEHCKVYTAGVEQQLFDRGLCLPSGSILTDEQIGKVIEVIKKTAR